MTRPTIFFNASNNASEAFGLFTPVCFFWFLAATGATFASIVSSFNALVADDRFDVLPRKKPSDVLREALIDAELYDQAIKNEIKKRGKLGDHFAWVLLQLHEDGKLTDRVKKALHHYRLETLEQCIVAIINFNGDTSLTRQKRNQLRDYLSNRDFQVLATLLLKYQALSSSNVNQLIDITPQLYPYYVDIFESLDKHRALSRNTFHNIMQLGTGAAFSYFKEVLGRLETSRLVTKLRIDQLFSTPWLLTEKAYYAIWLRVGDLEASEFWEIIARIKAAVTAGHEPGAEDFRDQSGRMSPSFVFFETPNVIPPAGRNAELLADFAGEIPDEFLCACSKQPMTDPVRIVGQPDSHVFEREWIMRWVSIKQTNPLTNLPLDKIITFVPATDISEKIEAFVAEHGKVRSSHSLHSFFTNKASTSPTTSTTPTPIFTIADRNTFPL